MIHPSICYKNSKHFSLTPLGHWLFQSNKCPRIWCKHCPGGAERSGLWRWSRNGCQDSQGTLEVPVPGPSPALGLCQGRGSSGSSQPSAREQKLKLCWAPSSPEPREHRHSCRALLGPKQPCSLCCSEPGSAPTPGPGLQLLLSSKDTFKHDLHQQRGKSISAVPTLQRAFPLVCTFTSNYWAFQPWKINFTLFHSKLYLSLYGWLQHTGAWLVCLCFFFLTKRLIFN